MMSVAKCLAIAATAAAVGLPPVANAGRLTTILSFNGAPGVGGAPYAGVTEGVGLLYGNTNVGGAHNKGLVFALDPNSGAETVLRSFENSEPSGPYFSMIYDGGRLYGSTPYGNELGGGDTKAAPNYGTIFRLHPAIGHHSVIHRFENEAGGEGPGSGLIYNSGELYGTTIFGGSGSNGGQGQGVVFKLNPNTKDFSVLYAGQNYIDPGQPMGLTYDNGMLYVTSRSGGGYGAGYGYGTILTINTTTGAEAILYTFGTVADDGQVPNIGNPIFHDGLLYGTTASGGTYTPGVGTVWAINTTTHTEQFLYRFGLSPDGNNPEGTMSLHAGKLYGTTVSGGGKGCRGGGCGTIFAVNATTGLEHVLYTFTGGPDGASPYSGLIYYKGAFYGTTLSGNGTGCGGGGCGTVFKFVP